MRVSLLGDGTLEFNYCGRRSSDVRDGAAVSDAKQCYASADFALRGLESADCIYVGFARLAEVERFEALRDVRSFS